MNKKIVNMSEAKQGGFKLFLHNLFVKDFEIKIMAFLSAIIFWLLSGFAL